MSKDQSGTNLPNTPSMTARGSEDYTGRLWSEVSGSDQVPYARLSMDGGVGRQVKTFGVVVALGQIPGLLPA